MTWWDLLLGFLVGWSIFWLGWVAGLRYGRTAKLRDQLTEDVREAREEQAHPDHPGGWKP